jgi:glyceraldehyde-3-phosphate dehydrogenase/erythrose-4-phosphate dehydrogenase
MAVRKTDSWLLQLLVFLTVIGTLNPAVKERKSNCNVNEKEIKIAAEYKRSKYTYNDYQKM